jgi:putative ABC transport system permease protein
MTPRYLARKLAYWFRRDKFTEDLREEMELHLHLRARKLREQGVREDDAPFAARRLFGNTTAHYEASAAVWGWESLERLLQDFRQGARTLRKAPGFTAVAILTLALGLGINTAVFSLVNAVVLRPLPYAESGRLISIYEAVFHQGPANLSSSGAELGGRTDPARTEVSVANLPDYRRARAFAGLAHCQLTSTALTGLGAPEQINGEAVSSNFFDVLRVEPELGRGFLPEDERPGAAPVVVITHYYWQRRLGGDTDVLARSIMLDGRPYQVIGVLAPAFRSPFQLTVPDTVEFYTPAVFPPDLLRSRENHEINVVGRLNPGYSILSAQAELDVIAAGLAKQYPASNANIRPVVTPLRDDLARNFSSSLLALLGASMLIVLITSVNVANLLLVRAVAREHESSVRRALGASRFRMARQFLVESLLLAAGGCMAGLGLGLALIRILLAEAPANIPRIHEVSMDWRVFAVATVVATLTGLIFGLAPAWHASQARASESLRAAGRTTGRKAQAWWRAGLTTAEIALSVMLLIGAGLLLKSFVTMTGMELGFQPERVIAMKIRLPDLRYPSAEQRLHFFQQLEERVRALPGVQSAAYANRMPLRGGWGGSTNVDTAPDRDADTDKQVVSPGYFETLGIPVKRGRVLTEGDRDGQPAVAVVNKAFARELLAGLNPIGHRLRLGAGSPWMTIVGVVNDIRRGGKDEEINPQVYIPAAQAQLYPVRPADFAVRAASDPRQLITAIQAQVLALDKDQPVSDVRTMEELIDASAAQRRFETLLLSTFASVAVLLATIGIFGVLSYVVSQRTSELGIRMALGASPRRIVALVLRQAGVWIVAGVALGVGGALGLTRYLEALLFHVKGDDPWTYASAIALLGTVAMTSALIPALRGSRTDPVSALRHE